MGREGPRYEYMRVADEIEARIRRGDWKFGARLPGRGTLAERLRESEMTVRRALRELQERGVVRVLPSSGVYVTWQAGHEEGTPDPLATPRNHFQPLAITAGHGA